MIRLILTLFFIFLLIGCGGTFQPPDKEEPPTRKSPEKPGDKYEPLGLKEDLVVVPETYALKMTTDSVVSSGTAEQISSTLSDSFGSQVYRIQLFTSKEYGPASREVDIATEVFGKEVSLDYEVPYYKVRVGKFAELDEAEEYMMAAREAGYSTAWVVKTNIDVNKLEEIYDDETMPPADTVDTMEPVEPGIDTTDENLEYPEY
jgi:hypothetical protein